MKIEAFATLDAVLRLGTMAAAAQEGNITPSAVSMQMKQIETYMGQQLFDRSGLNIKPLPLAYEVSDTMQPSLRRLESLRNRTTIVVEGTIRFGVIESLQPILIPGVMRTLAERYPRLRLLPGRGKSAALIEAVKAGLSDAAVVAQPESGGSSRLSWYPLFQRELVVIVPQSESETSLKALFSKYDWIRYDRKSVTGRLAARYINRYIQSDRGTIELDGVRAIAATVSAGLGVSMVQIVEPGILLVYPVRVMHVPHAPKLRFALVTRRGEGENRQVAALRDALTTVVRRCYES
ncbi:LysR family transcriptional regulator [Allopusillimonas soli]|uniref:LysR family transcriptional regulator n=1 Tax=Allopusillimonas soli TaxID=659016 RepID=A0A853FAC6_9BURK|nr:LysR family transcriptional regulator [Allopusillimonas soli]NYT35880.1 LysR family transcriptional regulator [Allopusillimonas soli]TEA76244.1 LysR family transcriptional regulator [Allopusillimonas soli]